MLFRKSKYYKNCDELPLHNFIQLIINNDLNQLIISGKPKNLQLIWNDIFNEYTKLTQNEEHIHVFSLLKEISFTGNKLYLISVILDSLSLGYNKDLCNNLESLGIRPIIKSGDQFEKSLLKANTIFKGLILSFEKKKKEFESSDNKEKVKKSDYDNLLVSLSKFQGYRLDPKEISVSEFVSIMNSYSKYVKELNKNHGKQR